MPVHAPGPSLYSSIPFRYLAQVGRGSSRGVNVALNVTPFVDMMTILVTFLLMVFSASGELIQAQKGLKLPSATNKDDLKRAPVIVVTQYDITFQGDDLGVNVTDVHESESLEFKIIPLFDRMKKEKESFAQNRDSALRGKERDYCDPDWIAQHPDPSGSELCLDGLVILQADQGTSAKVLNRVIKTAYAAEYPRIMFAINRRSQREN